MHVDLDEISASPVQPYQADICILGGGIAGLVLATRLAARLAGQGRTVHLLEAGGLTPEPRSQAFYATEQAATTHRGATDGRFRTFGGSSTQWGGQLLPFTPDIFTPPAGVPSRPWPITADDLTPHYAAIAEIFGLNPLPYDAALLPALGHPAVPFSADFLLRFSKWAPFAKRNVAQTLGQTAIASPDITLYTHANAVELVAANGRLTEVRALNYAGTPFTFRAAHFVVAAGTVESSRLLLASTTVPDPNDQAGRYFNDHLGMHAAFYEHTPERASLLEKLGPFFVGGTLHTCKIEASPELRAREQLLAVMAHVIVLEPEDSGTAAIRNLLRSVQSGKLKEAIGQNLTPMLRGSSDVVRLVYNARVRKRRAVSARARVLINIDVEQHATAANRIRLSSTKDALGVPKAIVDWRVSDPERATALRFAQILQPELTRLGLAPHHWNEALAQNRLPDDLLDTYHAMGGLCMGTDPAASVVTPDLQHHHVPNLHIASCAVFPSGSSSNPTFTMMALTLRLADRLAALGQ